MSDTIKIAMVEDDQLIRESLAALIKGTDGFTLLGSYESCEQFFENDLEIPPDIVLMDIDLPGISGIEGTQKVKAQYKESDVLMLTVHENDELVFKALCAGACGYLTKNVQPARLIESIKDAHNGGAPMSTRIARMVVESFQKSTASPLTERETEILNLLSRGKSYKMIADDLFIDKETVRTHIKNIYRKLEVHSKAEAIEKALKEKLI